MGKWFSRNLQSPLLTRNVSDMLLFLTKCSGLNLASFTLVVYQAVHMDIRPAGAPVMTFPPVHVSSQITPTPPLPPPTRTPMQNVPVSTPPQYAPYQQQPGYGTPYGSGPWPYQYAGHPVPSLATRGPSVYYPNPGPAFATHDPSQAYSYAPLAQTYRGRSHANLQWQPSYTGPRANHSVPNQIHYYQYPPPPQPPTSSTTASTSTQ
jgi:hypothetical protein